MGLDLRLRVTVDFQLITELPPILNQVQLPDEYAENVICRFFSDALDQISADPTKPTVSADIAAEEKAPFDEAKYADTQTLLANLRAYLDAPDADQQVADLTIQIPSFYDERA